MFADFGGALPRATVFFLGPVPHVAIVGILLVDGGTVAFVTLPRTLRIAFFTFGVGFVLTALMTTIAALYLPIFSMAAAIQG